MFYSFKAIIMKGWILMGRKNRVYRYGDRMAILLGLLITVMVTMLPELSIMEVTM
jgi:hypothetical protein